MPFIEAGSSTPKCDVGLRQLIPAGARFDGKVYFTVLDDFGYVHPGSDNPPGTYPEPQSWLRVPRRQQTDLASIPPFLWGVLASYGTHTMPALIHDRLCEDAKGKKADPPDPAEPACPALRRWADQHFRRMLRDEARVGIATRWAMWAAIRLFSFLPLAIVWFLLLVAIGGALVLGVIDRGDPDPWLIASGFMAAALVVVAVIRSFERPWDFGEETEDPAVKYRPIATGSLVGASAIALCAAPVFLPVVLVTVFVKAILENVDDLLYLLSKAMLPLVWLYRRLQPYPTVVAGTTSPGDDRESTPPAEKAEGPTRGSRIAGAIEDEPLPAAGSCFPRL